MKIILLPLRIILAPVALLLTAALVPLALLLVLSTRVLAIISSIGIMLSLLLFLSGDYKNGGIFLLLAFLISPCGLPKVAEFIFKSVAGIRGAMWKFIFG